MGKNKDGPKTRLKLRPICEEFGNNEWSEDVQLADILEKHLHRHLHEKYGKRGEKET